MQANYLESPRLRLVPATVELADADLQGGAALAAALGVNAPEEWPPELHERPAVAYAMQLLKEKAEQGWSTWYLLGRQAPSTLWGVCGFKGRPNVEGAVEIAYSILPTFRNQGVASEAVARLVSWAFTQPLVEEVCAETMPHLVQSIRVLENNGFRPAGAGSEHGVVRYAVAKTALA